LALAKNLDAVFGTLTEELQHVLQNSTVVVFGRKSAQSKFTVVAAVGVDDSATRMTFDSAGALAKLLVDIVDPGQVSLPTEEAAHVARLGAVLAVPVRLHDDTPAFVCLGRKLAGEDYDTHDREFLEAAAEQAAAALERVKLRAVEEDARKAWDIQQSLLPTQMPELRRLQIAGRCQPARLVGGDYYDVLKASDQVLAICIGDVVGKGMPAALRMASLHAAVRALAANTEQPGTLCQGVNKLISEDMRPGEFITFFVAFIEGETLRLRYTNAGHNPPLLCRSDGEVLRMEEGGPVLGILPDSAYDEDELQLQSGDRLLLYTDGVSEAGNSDGDEFGEDRIAALLRQSGDIDAESLARSVMDAVTDFSAGPFRDDVTVVAITVS
jgi:sigma-B regulation protein RsbU (phosphoserine phosphatase)